MTRTVPDTASFYEISEMAGMFDISRQTLIYYDRIGLFKPAYVNEKGYRFYAPTQIPLLRLICILRDFGIELKEIEQLVVGRDLVQIAARLRERVEGIDEQVAVLSRQRAAVAERLAFYEDVEYWRDRFNRPVMRHYAERFVVFEPFPSAPPNRHELHATLMRAACKMRGATGLGPVRGWGTMLQRDAFHNENPLVGAGAFVVVPEGVDPAGLPCVRMLPEGTYLCLSRWGMPYDDAGIKRLVRTMDEHRLKPVGNAFDFCLLDTTSYDEYHNEDFCCLQVPVEL